MDCFAEPVIGRAFAPTRWPAMTVLLIAEALLALSVINGVHHNTLDQVLLGDDYAKHGVIRNEFLDELVHAVLEDIVHVAVLQAIADTAGMALRGALPAIGDADLVEIAHQIAVTTGQRTRQRIVEDQEVGDQPWL